VEEGNTAAAVVRPDPQRSSPEAGRESEGLQRPELDAEKDGVGPVGREYKYRPHVGTPLGWTGGLGVPLHTETVLSGGDRQERREGGNDVPNDLVDALFHRAAGIAMSTRRSALAIIHHGNRVRS